MSELHADFWNSRYENNLTGWDLGYCSPALKFWMDKLDDKSLKILIPGAGNAYEVDYLLEKGFEDITVVDIAPVLIESLDQKYTNRPEVSLVLGDFFNLQGKFDVVLEQTFFCAIPTSMRSAYVEKMTELLAENGRILGVLFNRVFDGGPPFGGSVKEYEELFHKEFDAQFSPCTVSHPARMGSEVLMHACLR